MTKNICLDLRCLQIGHENRGIGMHVRSILENLETTPDAKFFFYVFDKSDPIKDLKINIKVPYTLISTPTIKMSINDPRDFFRLLRIIWHAYKPLKNFGIDEFVQFDFTLGMPRQLKIQTTLVAYDLIPLIMRSIYIPGVWRTFRTNKGPARLKRSLRAAYYKWRFGLHYKEFARADKIISISEDTKQSLIERLAIPEEKITTIPLAPVFEKDIKPNTGVLKDIKRPYLFYIGATDARKRVQDLVAAFNIVRGRGHDLSLILAGGEFKNIKKIPNDSIKRTILSSSYIDDIKAIGFVDDSEKIALYQNAFAFVFPTTYEGFGLPVVEAMQQNCPVVSYDNSSIPEVAGDAALLVETGDVLGIVHAVEELLSNEGTRRTLKKRGIEQAKLFTWQTHTKLFIETIVT